MKIVTLIASATEIVCALGFEDHLVGRSHECDHPPSVLRLPAVTEPKFPTDGTSYAIDERVKAILQEGLSVYRVHADALAALAPDVVVTQDQCQVCAVSLADVEGALCTYTGTRPAVVSLLPNCLEDIWADIRRVAAVLGAPERGEALVGDMRGRMRAVADAARALPRVGVAVVEWIDPLMAAGNWMPELVEMAGGTMLFGETGKHSPWMTFEALAAADPEVILVCPCGFDVARTRVEMPALAGAPGWADLRAVRAGRVALADGNQFFHRPGPRLVDSLHILAEVVHPEAFTYAGKGWERW